MPIIAFFAFIILIGLSGGISANLTSGQPEDSSERRASSSVSTLSPANDYGQREIIRTAPNTTVSNRNNANTGASSDANTQTQTVPVANSSQEEVVDLRPPSIEVMSAQNIEDNSATIRGVVDMRGAKDGLVFTVYGYSENDVQAIGGQYNTYADIPELNNDRARTFVLDRRAKQLEEYDRRVTRLVPDTDYHFKLCVEYKTLFDNKLIKCSDTKSFNTNPTNIRSNNFALPSVSLNRVLNIDAGGALLSGSVRMNDGIDGKVFFVHGEYLPLIREVEDVKDYSAVREFGRDLQKNRVATGVRGRGEYSYELDDLDSNTVYYYRMCVEYDGQRDGIRCTSVRNFTTNSRNQSIVPYVETRTVVMTANTVSIPARAEMNNFNDGIVFLVLGTDIKQVTRSVEASSFSRLRQYGDSIQKILLDSDLDGKKTYTKTFFDLNIGDTYFYRTCVEYESRDEYNRVDIFLQCGEVKSFVAK